MSRIIQAASCIPPGFYLRLQVENHEDGGLILTACVFQEPPDDGWPEGRDGCEFDDRVLFGVTAYTAENFEDYLVEAITRRWPTPIAEWT